jgi:hypothetical protein
MEKNDRYLRLHNADDNTVIIIPTDEIIYVNTKTDDSGEYTTIGMYSLESEVAVNETPDKIYNIVKKSGFVRCHRNTDNTVELFNKRYFVMSMIDSNDKVTVIRLENNIEMGVNETPEKIYNLLIEAKKIFETEESVSNKNTK